MVYFKICGPRRKNFRFSVELFLSSVVNTAIHLFIVRLWWKFFWENFVFFSWFVETDSKCFCFLLKIFQRYYPNCFLSFHKKFLKEKFFLEKNTFSFTTFRTLTKNYSVFCWTFSGEVVKATMYLARRTIRGKMILWKKIVFPRTQTRSRNVSTLCRRVIGGIV